MNLTYASDLRGMLAGCRLFLALLSALITTKGHCQEPPRPEIDINHFIAELFPIPPGDADASELYESLIQLYTSPLDLNTATADELSNIFILSEKQIRSFVYYREKLGPLLSLYELQAVPDFDLPSIQRLLPFVTLGKRAVSIRESLKDPGQHFLMARSGRLLEQQKGFAPADSGSSATTRYQGTPWTGYLRYRNARTGSHSIGFTLEKDAGENLWDWRPKRHIFGADFLSFHAQVMNRGWLKNLIIGDFQMQSGQGLVSGAGFSLGKGSEVVQTIYRSTTGLRAYTSATEANFFRGAAVTVKIAARTDVTALISRTKRDATQETQGSETVATSLPTSGYHRTPSEVGKHNLLTEWNAGVHILHRFRSQSGQAGFTFLQTHYSALFRKRDLPYNRYEFSGKTNFTAAIHGDYRWHNFHFFGEGAMSLSGGVGLIAGSVASLGKKWDCSLLLRHYARDFHTLYGNSLSEATRPINETGAYAGLRYSPRRWQFSAYYDYFRFPWLKYQVDAPSHGFDYLGRVLWKPRKHFNGSVLFHEKHKEGNQPGSREDVTPVVHSIRRTFMFQVEYEIPLKCVLRSRLQYGGQKYEGLRGSSGFTVLQDVTWHFARLEATARLAVFKTDDYDSRQYVYEKDFLYAFSIPAYYDTGTRHYLMLLYNMTKKLKIWLRWSQTRYQELDKISSGLNEIQGNKRSEIKMQVMYQL